ncbi:hypothetical protein BO99DRAFT_71239 [Aspergillus violaceofuscus CBS 115571]|uniref:Uncharacterized protein n=1 Tax=Aspergillus violaceofuscus (strain CBS 115571) TaxID=1450538 RepID=A0A2V5IC50_ASPV1|nr:hypothetical protein BO99DRAFT_71239 [Aspergillus violaceofuscus CBS 115571]
MYGVYETATSILPCFFYPYFPHLCIPRFQRLRRGAWGVLLPVLVSCTLYVSVDHDYNNFGETKRGSANFASRLAWALILLSD